MITFDWRPIAEARKDKPLLIFDPAAEPRAYVVEWDDHSGCWVEAGGERYAVFQPTMFVNLSDILPSG